MHEAFEQQADPIQLHEYTHNHTQSSSSSNSGGGGGGSGKGSRGRSVPVSRLRTRTQQRAGLPIEASKHRIHVVILLAICQGQQIQVHLQRAVGLSRHPQAAAVAEVAAAQCLLSGIATGKV